MQLRVKYVRKSEDDAEWWERYEQDSEGDWTFSSDQVHEYELQMWHYAAAAKSRIAQLTRELDVLQGIVARPSIPLKEYLHEADRAEAALTQAQAERDGYKSVAEEANTNGEELRVAYDAARASISALMEAAKPFYENRRMRSLIGADDHLELERVYEQVKNSGV